VRELVASAQQRVLSPVVAATAACAVAVAWLARSIASGSTRDLLLGIGSVVAVPAALVALTRPMLFPYGLYAALVPFEAFSRLGVGAPTITRFIGLAAAIALAFHGLRTGRLAKLQPSVLILVALCGYVVLSTMWSIAPEDAWREAFQLLMFSALYLAAALYVPSRSDLRILLWAIIIGGVCVGALAAYQYHFRDIIPTVYEQTYGRMQVTLGGGSDAPDPNMLADGLLLPFALLAAKWMRARSFRGWVLCVGLLGTLILGAAAVASREALLAMLLELVVAGVILRNWRRILTGVAMLGAGILAMPDVILRVVRDAGGSGRFAIWHVGWNAFRENPLFGSGSGSFATAFERWYLGTFIRYDTGWLVASHNFFVHYGVEFGLIGLGLAITWWIVQWRTAKALPRDGEMGELRAALLAAVIGLATICVLVDAFDAKFVWLTFALIAQARALALAQSQTPLARGMPIAVRPGVST
jgi:O-antigen ligase